MPLKNKRNNKNILKNKLKRKPEKEQPNLGKQWANIQNKTTIQVLKAAELNSKALKPQILVEIGHNFIIELALVDIGANINAISYETWELIGKPTLERSSIIVDIVSRHTNAIEGCLNMNLFIDITNVHERFFVMKPSRMCTPIILGQPWQCHYNRVPNWK